MKRLGTAAVTLLLMLVANGVASAEETLTFGAPTAETADITLVSSGSLTLADSLRTINVACPASLTGTFREEEITIAEGVQIGTLTSSRVETARCTGGTLTFTSPTRESSARMSYVSLLGTRPLAVTAIKFRIGEVVLQTEVTISRTRVTCTYRGNVDSLMELRGIDAYEVGSSSIVAAELTKSAGPESCPRTASLRGTLSIQNPQRLGVMNVVALNPSGHDFGSLRRREESRARPFVENKLAAEELTVERSRKDGAGCASYEYNMGQIPAGLRIMGGGTAGIEVTFEPAANGLGYVQCIIEIYVRRANSDVYRVAFSARGTGL
ncbi:MAG TPA: hypothetical protein VE972_10040 [Conexibacter sp.]|nr:hypothetical protein [Conexibacter sp.]